MMKRNLKFMEKFKLNKIWVIFISIMMLIIALSFASRLLKYRKGFAIESKTSINRMARRMF